MAARSRPSITSPKAAGGHGTPERESEVQVLNGTQETGGFLIKPPRGHDIVFHVAARADIRRSSEDDGGDLRYDLAFNPNVPEAMINDKVGGIGFASTSAPHGRGR
jgi:hypothetical protein